MTREQLAAFLSRFAQYNDAKIIEADGQLSTDAVVSGRTSNGLLQRAS